MNQKIENNWIRVGDIKLDTSKVNQVPVFPGDMEPNCTQCKDTGWVKYKKNGMEFAGKCSCVLKERITQAIPVEYQKDWNGAGYKIDYLHAGYKFLESNKRILLLWGKTGVGKTFLAWKLFEKYLFMKNNQVVNFITTIQLEEILHLRRSGGILVNEMIKKYDGLVVSDFLILDEFYASPIIKTDDFIAKFETFWFELMSEGVRKIIITMNENPELSLRENAITTYDRFRENSEWIEIVGSSRRL